MLDVYKYYNECQDIDDPDDVMANSITVDKLRFVASKLSEELDEETARKMIEVADILNKGYVEQDSFMRLMWKLGLYDRKGPDDHDSQGEEEQYSHSQEEPKVDEEIGNTKSRDKKKFK